MDVYGWDLDFRIKRRGDIHCQHRWEKVFEGPRPAMLFWIFFLPCLRFTHCDNRHMVRAELAVVRRCSCGAEDEAVYGNPGRICLICNHAEDATTILVTNR